MTFTNFLRCTLKRRIMFQRIAVCLLSLLMCIFILNVFYRNNFSYKKNDISENRRNTLGPPTEKSPSFGANRVDYVKNKRYVCMKLHAGLGNKLWQYSSLYALAKNSGRIPVVCTRKDFTSLFGNLTIQIEDSTESKCLTSGVRMQKPRVAILYQSKILEKLKESLDTNITLYGSLQNFKYSGTYINDMKRDFAIRKEYQIFAQKYLHEVLETRARETQAEMSKNMKGEVLLNGKKPTFVIVHVRRGDMLHSKYAYVPDSSYFKNAMTYMRRKHGENTIFIVATNGIEWSKENIKGTDVYFTGEPKMKSFKEDFAIGLACNHTIMSVGTFGWWMGFLTAGDVVFYKDWPKPKYKPYLVESDLFPEHWVPLS